MHNYTISQDISPDDSTWKEWRALVESEGWTSDDHSVMVITPHISTTRSVVAKDGEGKFMGSVVWNEYDGVAFIGFYLLEPAHRGKGIGSIIWKQAIARMEGFTIGLRSVPYMATRYQAMDTPIEGAHLNSYDTEWTNIYQICEAITDEFQTVKLTEELKPEEYIALEKFDREVTGKDRSDFLKRYNALPFTKTAVILSENGEVIAMASVTSTSTADSHLFKLSPIYAENIVDALTVSKPLISYISKVDPEARILFHILSGTRGEKELQPLLAKNNVNSKLSGITLFSKSYENPIDKNRLYIAHNNSCHFDA